MTNLAELNEKHTSTREWGGYTMKTEVAVGRVGFRRSGEKIHVLFVKRVVTDHGSDVPVPSTARGLRYRAGEVFSAHAPCNSNGQHVGQVVSGFDIEQVTCEKCLRRLEAMESKAA